MSFLPDRIYFRVPFASHNTFSCVPCLAQITVPTTFCVCVQALSSLPLDKGQLENIAVVCRSPASVAQLLESGLPTVLAQGLAEFCSRQITLIVERNLVNDAERQQQQQQAPQQAAPDNGPRRGEWPDAGELWAQCLGGWPRVLIKDLQRSLRGTCWLVFSVDSQDLPS